MDVEVLGGGGLGIGRGAAGARAICSASMEQQTASGGMGIYQRRLDGSGLRWADGGAVEPQWTGRRGNGVGTH